MSKPKPKKTNFADFMDNDPRAVATNVKTVQAVPPPDNSSSKTRSIGRFQTNTKLQTKHLYPVHSKIILEEDVEDSTQNHSRHIEIVNVYETTTKTKKSNLTVVNKPKFQEMQPDQYAQAIEGEVVQKKKPTFGDYMDHLQSKEIDIVDEEETYDNGTLRIDATFGGEQIQSRNENLIEENGALNMYT